MISKSSEINTIPCIPLSKFIKLLHTMSTNLLWRAISYNNTIFNGFWSLGFILWMTSSKSILLGNIARVSFIILKTLLSRDSPPATTVLGCNDMIESIN